MYSASSLRWAFSGLVNAVGLTQDTTKGGTGAGVAIGAKADAGTGAGVDLGVVLLAE